jgi:hypothetical protein
MTDNLALIDRIDARLQALAPLSDRKASMRAINKPDLIRDIRRGKEVGAERLRALARALETSVDYLLGVSEKADNTEFNPESMDKDIPVYGTALGASEDIWEDHKGEVAIEQTDLNTGEVIDYFRRPPSLRDRRDVYVLYTAGDSMSPAYEEGSPILVDPRQPPSLRDYVVAYLRDTDDEYASAVLIKRLVRRSSSFVELEQYNPPAIFRMDAKRFRAMHRVKPWGEVFGV